MIERASKKLSVKRQCELLCVSRASLYYQPVGASPTDLAIMRFLDEQYLKTPFFGTRRMMLALRDQGYNVGRRRVRRLMRIMGMQTIYQKPKTSIASPEHKIYPYLLGGITIDRPGQVSAADITYIPMARGFLYLVVIMDWHSRFILSWRLSNTMEASFCAEALKESFVFGLPDISNTDQGSQFTSTDYTDVLKDSGVAISMDGRGRWMDNVFVERFWRSLKYEEVYLRAYDSIAEARAGISAYIEFYNYERPHQALGNRTPWEAYRSKSEPASEAAFGVDGLLVKQHASEIYNMDQLPYLLP